MMRHVLVAAAVVTVIAVGCGLLGTGAQSGSTNIPSRFERASWYMVGRSDSDTVRHQIDSTRTLLAMQDSSAIDLLLENIRNAELGDVRSAVSSYGSYALVDQSPYHPSIANFLAENPMVHALPVFQGLTYESGRVAIVFPDGMTDDEVLQFADSAELMALAKDPYAPTDLNIWDMVDTKWPELSAFESSRNLYKFQEVIRAWPGFLTHGSLH